MATQETPKQTADRLKDAISAVCPINGIEITDPASHAVKIDFQPGANEAQKTAANAVVTRFDWPDAHPQAAAKKSSDPKHDAYFGAKDFSKTPEEEKPAPAKK